MYLSSFFISGGMHGDGETPMINGDIDDRRYVSSSPSSSFKEDSVEIDALLSMDDEYDDVVDDGGGGDDDDNDDVMSTGRTPGSYNSCCSSPDSACSTLATRKKARVKKMVKALRGIVPGGEQMETPVFLDEAVKYLKSLKMEVSKLGIPKTVN